MLIAAHSGSRFFLHSMASALLGDLLLVGLWGKIGGHWLPPPEPSYPLPYLILKKTHEAGNVATSMLQMSILRPRKVKQKLGLGRVKVSTL